MQIGNYRWVGVISVPPVPQGPVLDLWPAFNMYMNDLRENKIISDKSLQMTQKITGMINIEENRSLIQGNLWHNVCLGTAYQAIWPNVSCVSHDLRIMMDNKLHATCKCNPMDKQEG